MKQIFHHYEKWEDWKAGFYEISRTDKQKIVDFFNDQELLKECMQRASEEWKHSFEQNMTNPNVNKIAYIGQAASCIYTQASCFETMAAWNMLSEDIRNSSDEIAKQVYNDWIKNNENL